jgi:hypothetical protein
MAGQRGVKVHRIGESFPHDRVPMGNVRSGWLPAHAAEDRKASSGKPVWQVAGLGCCFSFPERDVQQIETCSEMDKKAIPEPKAQSEKP